MRTSSIILQIIASPLIEVHDLKTYFEIDDGTGKAIDRIEYAEAAARYGFDILAAGGAGEDLSVDEIGAIRKAENVTQTIF